MGKKWKWIWGCCALLVIFGLVGKSFHLFKGHKKHRPRATYTTVVEEKPFVVIIPSYNNRSYCERNLQSVLTQHYNNFRVIYIDDCSTDGTFQKVQDVICTYKPSIKIDLIKNDQNRGALANLYHAVHSCENNEIIVTVDGDDFLAHEEVLSKLNRVYANPHVWMTYGNFLDYPSYRQKPVACKKTPKKIIQKNSFRTHEWIFSHLRTFYAGLFKQVRLQDLIYQGGFLPMAGDLGFMFPLLEMAGRHSVFIKDILYLYNRTNPLSDHITNFPFQEQCAMHVRKLARYQRLKQSSFMRSEEDKMNADLIAFSFDRPLQLYAFLESLERYAKNLNHISIIYRCSNDDYAQAYEKVNAAFPYVEFIKQSSEPNEDFKNLVMQTGFFDKKNSSDYILFSVDDVLLKDGLDIRECIRAMQQTSAYGFYLSHGAHLNYCYMLDCAQPVPPSIKLKNDIYAWQFRDGQADWRYQHSLDMVLYRKKDIQKDFIKLSFHNPNSLEHYWNLRSKLNRVGLYYTRSKCVNIPLNLVNDSTNRNLHSYSPQELLEKFNAGFKIDISKLNQIANHSRHMDFKPTFIPIHK
ncbi:MAG TPA: glycosyltransferase family A protein [Rhabdochlamydiaceae bacterium]|nr:glycosyltransferase family A protein [Rhabdochlamydiaceae bacterium]